MAVDLPRCSGPPVTALPEIVAAQDQLLTELNAVFLENESAGGRVAYCLSDAKMTNGLNGLSFGFNQYDLRRNSNAASILADILEKAHAANPELSLSQADIDSIRAGKLSFAANSLSAIVDETLGKLLNDVDAALSTAAARRAINERYIDSLRNDVATLDTEVSALSETVRAKSYLSTNRLGRLVLLDYENFLGHMGRQFKSYLNGEMVTLKAGTISISGAASFTDIMRFYLATKQGAGANRDERAEVLRRLNNVVKQSEAIEGAAALAESDKAYLSGSLADILSDPDNPFIKAKRVSGQYRSLEKLIDRARVA
ncbi:MAG: hypothetical protein WAW96_20090 [Alphaproteobacteria bacterium]